MGRQVRINGAKKKKVEPEGLAFTVIYLPVDRATEAALGAGKRQSEALRFGKILSRNLDIR
jgi:hypothetical protein